MSGEGRDWSLAQSPLAGAMLDRVNDHVLACDVDGTITMMNRAMLDAVGDEPTSITSDMLWSLWDCRHVDDSPLSSADFPLTRALRGDAVAGQEMIVRVRAGSVKTMLVDAKRVADSYGRPLGAVLVMQDVTGQRHAEARAAFLAVHDGVTGLPNRALFLGHLARALERAEHYMGACGLMVVNVDGLEDLNARLGFDAGDEVLAQAAARLQKAIRSTDHLSRDAESIARLGSHEFLIVCERVAGIAGARAVMKRVAAAFEPPMSIGTERIPIQVHIGMTVTSETTVHPEVLIWEAKSALRRVRESGVGTSALFAEEMRASDVARRSDEQALRSALERDEFSVVYQPKVALATDRVVGVEALLRWDHPERGPVSPSVFIPLAEKTGLIVAIGAWVLRQACLEGVRWLQRAQGSPAPTVSVNLSAGQFDSSLLDTLRTVLDETGMDPNHLCLEVTESMMMDDPDLATEMLRQIKALGVHVSIDDFGTGYSSLAYLRRFPLTELKIDKSFVDGLGRDPEATAIVAAVMGMAHALDLSVVAEGVETIDQLEALRALGCDEAQGYYYARPLPAANIDALLAKERLDGDKASTVGSEGKPAWGAGTVVIVDDMPEVRLLARMSLTAVGFGVYEAESGADGIELIRRVRPDCVVLDMHMPGLSGLDVCRVLRAEESTCNLTIVMLTADGKAAEKAEAFSLEADDYIVKPLVPRDLVSRVTAAIRRRAEHSDDQHPTVDL